MSTYLFHRTTSDDTRSTVLDAIFVGKPPDVVLLVHLIILLASVSLLFLLLIAVAVLHCIVRRRQRQTSSNWTSNQTLCLINPQSAKGPEVYVLDLSPASEKDVEKVLQQSSLGASKSSPFSFPLVTSRSSTPMGLDASVPVCLSNAKVNTQGQGKILTTSMF